VEPIQLAAVLALVVLVASVVSVELGVTVALVELTLGVVAGNLFDLESQQWLDFVAAFGSIVLTFLGPFVVAALTTYVALDWSGRASLIAGTALSTTSLAVVYAVLVERGLSDTRIGKLLMSATFVTDLCTALALSAIFVTPNLWFPAFLTVSVALIVMLPRIAPWFFGRYSDRLRAV
jgi:Kef-type K+ transport system membrane component KefB